MHLSVREDRRFNPFLSMVAHAPSRLLADLTQPRSGLSSNCLVQRDFHFSRLAPTLVAGNLRKGRRSYARVTALSKDWGSSVSL